MVTGEPEDSVEIEGSRGRRGTDELEGVAPNCPADLVPMEAAGSTERPYWQCPACGQTSIAE